MVVVTRSFEENTTPTRPQRNQAYWKTKKKQSPTILYVKKEPESSSSDTSDFDDTSDFESKNTQNKTRSKSIPQKHATQTSSKQTSSSSLHPNPNVGRRNGSAHMNDPPESSSSETQVLVQSGRRSFEANRISLRHLKSKDLNLSRTSISRELPFRKARYSIGSTLENHTVEEMLEKESEWSFSDESSSCTSSSSVQKANQFKGPLKRQLFRKCQLNKCLKNKSSIYPSSDSEIEISRNNSLVKIPSNKNDFQIKSFEICITRVHNISPERSSAKKQSINFDVKDINAITSNTLQTNVQKENTGGIAVCYQDIEDLLRQLHGSSDSEVEKNEKTRKLPSPIKISKQHDKSKDSEAENDNKKTTDLRKLRFPRKKKLQNESSSDLEQENRVKLSHKRKFFTPANKIQTSDEDSDDDNCKSKYGNEKSSQNDNHMNHVGKRDIDLNSRIIDALKCNICDERFTYRHVLRRHQQLMHEKRADYQCSLCGETFKRSDYLKNHERIVHLHNLFECRYCDKKYKYKHSKEIHEKKHETEKLFKCPLSFCSKQFSRKDNFKKHKMMHKLKKLRAARKSKFICDKCDKTFPDKSILKIHVQKHFNKLKD